MLFSFLLQMSMTCQSYILPFYFQAVKGTTAKISGLDILPYGVTITVATIISGSVISYSGYHIPWMWAGAAIFSVGSGLLHTLNRSSPMSKWFGYQVLGGIGYGVTVQIPFFAIQVPLGQNDIAPASALVALCQSLGGAVGLAISQNIFQNALKDNLAAIQGVDQQAVVASGGVALETFIPWTLLNLVRDAFGGAIAEAYWMPIACAATAFAVSLAIEWGRIGEKKKKEAEAVTVSEP
jgi:hypothetical protein